MKKIMVKYLELQTNIKIDNYNGYTNLYKSDILVIDDKEITEAFYNFDKKVYSVNCYETTRFSIDNHSFQNDETLIYMLLNMGLITDITTQYNRNRLIDDVLKIQ